MDPDAALKRLRELLGGDSSGRIVSTVEVEKIHSLLCEAEEVFQGLDEWLKKGGFPPNDWYHPPAERTR